MKKLSFLFYSLMCIGVTTVSAQITVLHNFNDTLGEWPHGSLTLSGNKFYGMTQRGGIYDSGCIFSMDTNGNDYKDLFDFKGINGEQPLGSLTLSGKVLYGMTEVGGAHNLGCIFSIDTNGVNYKKLLDFNRINGAAPQLSSLSLSMGRLYGVTSSGGITHDSGCIFSIDTNGSGYKDLHDFNGTNGDAPCGSLTLYGSALYGMTEVGGAHNLGCIFSIDTNGSYYKDLLDFNTANGEYPYGSLIHSGGQLFGMTTNVGSRYGNIFSIDTNGSYYKRLFYFNQTDGEYPYGSLILSGSLLYGMTELGGVNSLINAGCIFAIDSNGSRFKDLLDFDFVDGYKPWGDLTISGNVLYGMTGIGGADNAGVIFKIDTDAVSTASINNLTDNRGAIKVYPNPNNGIFTIACHSDPPAGGEESLPIIKVYNILGEQVLTETLRSAQGDNTINLSNQQNGVYLYRVLNEDGSLVGEGKLIIQK